MDRLLYSRKEAATIISISVRQLDYLIERSHFKVTRIGSRVLIHRQEIERFAKGDWPQLCAQQGASMPKGFKNRLESRGGIDGAESHRDSGINHPEGLRGQQTDRMALAANASLNCDHKRIKASVGRPRKYATEMDRQKAAKKRISDYREKLRTRIKSMFPTCAECSAPATRIHWIGESGGSPRQTGKWARILRDPEYAVKFRGLCELHAPRPYFARAARGDVPKPVSWRGSRPRVVEASNQ